MPSAFMMERSDWKPRLKVAKAIWLPSRDQAGLKSSASVLDSTTNPVPSALRTQIRCGAPRLPSGCRKQVYASREPSGDHAGRMSSPCASVRFTTFVPSVFVRKMSSPRRRTAWFDERNRLRAGAWDGSRSWRRRCCDVNGLCREITVHRYRCQLTLNIIDAIDLPFPESACTDSERRGQIHSRKVVVRTCEWCSTVSRSILVIWSDSYVHTAIWIGRCNS